MKPLINKQEYPYIAQLYIDGMSKEKIQSLYGVSNSAIDRILKLQNVVVRDNSHKRRIYSLDENYFDCIDTPEKAYFLGLLYSDGCNYNKIHNIKLELQKEDIDIIEHFNTALGSNRPISIIQLSLKNDNWSDTARLTITNKHMSDQLMALGMIPNKSLQLIYPSWLSLNLFPHFLRGYIDGDGHIENGKSVFVSVAGTVDFCESIQSILLSNYDIYSSIYNTSNKQSSTRILTFTGMKNVMKLLHLIYSEASACINRKYQTYLSVCNRVNKSLLK